MNKPHKEYSKAIKSLTSKAEKGLLEAQFQLYENYTEGKYVEQKDIELADKYFQELQCLLPQKRMHLKSFNIHNFRRFKNINIDFDSYLTVIIGDNGTGKTSILDGISKIFSWFNNNLEKDDVNGKPITMADINVHANDYAEMSSTFELDETNFFVASLGRIVPGFSGSSPTQVSTIKQFATMYRKTAHNTSIMLPLLAFYSAERSAFDLKQSVSEVAFLDSSVNRYEALKDALEGSGKFESFSSIYIELVNLAEGEETKEIKELREQIASLEKVIVDVYAQELPFAGDRLLVTLSDKKEELNRLINNSSSGKYQKHLKYVNSAIEKLVSDVKNLKVDRSTGKSRILLENFGVEVNIAQLSKGQKTMVALAGDLARRLVTLNPDSKDPLSGPGIVLIDEVELHLHPKWQQEILLGLYETFPNIQFIVTTHSPQVLSTVDNTCIRKIYLDDNGEPIVGTPSFQTKGVTSADVLARIMGINSIPENLEEAKWVEKFSESLLNGNSSERDLYFKMILGHFGENHPVVIECQSQIRIMEMKSRWVKSEEGK
ncbi:AAA family ATPase [Serratia marcescens]|nr:AAA family ATPase [Serratia marcescens]